MLMRPKRPVLRFLISSHYRSSFPSIPNYDRKSGEEAEQITVDKMAAARSGGGLWEGLYRVFLRRGSVAFTFVVAGAFVGERVVDYGVHKLWEYNNVGKSYEDIPVLGQRPSE